MRKVITLLVINILLLLSSNIVWSNNIAEQVIEQSEYATFLQQDNAVVIDVRTEGEFNSGYIPGAINIPHKDIIKGRVNLEQFKGKQLLLYCHTGVRAGIALRYLVDNSQLKEKNMYYLKGDYRAWQARGKKIVKP